MKPLEVSGAVRPLYGLLGVKGLTFKPEETLGETTRRVIPERVNQWPNSMLDVY